MVNGSVSADGLQTGDSEGVASVRQDKSYRTQA